MNQAFFVKHEPCPKCHSRDNLGRWSDGHAHCFGCGYYEVGVRSLLLKEDNGKVQELGQRPGISFCKQLPADAYRWIKKYGITDEELQNHGIVWLPGQSSLAFGYEQESGQYDTRRYFGTNPNHPRYIHSKSKDFRVLDQTISGSRHKSHLVFVEDFVSAIKVSRICPASPVFGSTVGLERVQRGSKLFRKIGLWLDSDMYKKASSEVLKFQSLGYKVVGSIFAEGDPKDYSTGEIEIKVSGLFEEK